MKKYKNIALRRPRPGVHLAGSPARRDNELHLRRNAAQRAFLNNFARPVNASAVRNDDFIYRVAGCVRKRFGDDLLFV